MERVALVTGAGSGIGRHVAHGLLEAGYRVVLAGRRREALEETRGDDERATVVPADVSDPASVEALFAGLDRLDVLFNNAGTFGPAGAARGPRRSRTGRPWWTRTSPARSCARRPPTGVMKAQDPRGGRIINNGSISAHVPRPHAIAYTATKHAITGLTRAISLEGRAHDIACGQIDVGNAATEMAAAMQKGVLQANGTIAAGARHGRRATPPPRSSTWPGCRSTRTSSS